MENHLVSAVRTAAIAFGALALATNAQADEGGVRAGVLTCNVDSGWGFIFGSSRTLNCNYAAKPNEVEHYKGSISKFGVDIGYTQGGVIVWAVVAPTSDIAKGSLAGDYAGATGGASVGVGASANVLVGGSGNHVSLQPLSIEGNAGLNVAAGIAAISLKAQP